MGPNLPYGVVFSGGGALAAWEVGCYDAIQSRHGGEPPVVVTGASAGAINAVGVCASMSAPQLAELWSEIKPSDVYTLDFSPFGFALDCLKQRSFTKAAEKLVKGRLSIFNTAPLKETLRKKLSGYNGAFLQSPIYFAMSLTNLTLGKKEYFYKVPLGAPIPDRVQRNEGAIWTQVHGLEFLLDGLVGSTALPVVFPPQGPYFDGGVMLNQPITPALVLKEPKILYVIIPNARALGRTGNMLEIGQTTLEAWTAASLLSQLGRLSLINKMRVDRTDDAEPDIRLPVCVIRPSEDLSVTCEAGLLSFGHRVRDLVNDGRTAAAEKLNRFNPNDPHESTWYDVP